MSVEGSGDVSVGGNIDKGDAIGGSAIDMGAASDAIADGGAGVGGSAEVAGGDVGGRIALIRALNSAGLMVGDDGAGLSFSVLAVIGGDDGI